MISRIALSLALCLCLAELSSAQRGPDEGGRRPRQAATTPPSTMSQCMQAAMQCPPTKGGRPTTRWPPWETASLECLGRITPYTPRCQRRDSLAKDKLTEVTTRTLRLSARLSTSARPMALVGSPSTASSAPTEPSSTRTTSSATGGSTLTAPPLRSSTPSTTRLPQRGKPLQVTDWEPTEGNQSTQLLQNTQEMLLTMRGLLHLPGEGGAGGSVEAGGMEGEAKHAMKKGTKALYNGT